MNIAPIAQLDRASDFGSEGWGFDSLWVHKLEAFRSRRSAGFSFQAHEDVLVEISRSVHVYVLRSLADGNRYVGLSTDVPYRVEEHNSGKVKSTKARIPFVLVYQESFDTLAEARAREKYFKTAAGRRWLDKRRS